ncbi:hypothetical protein PRUPE_6G257800 [Prunus persica]|uniref:Uncharacterized protein n=1 Tax=Prunus persica TaxID=3760 RepID=A0A251NVZ7_PRUPE|nr:protein FAR-RED ELONGATED HYPOCOTYL 1 [Prunus persica]ONI03456.1 hypothetical protein PRUPE_6G257800 [Prunus persica]
METYEENPSQIDSSHVMSVLKRIKKRKFQAEQLGLPIPKHKCWERIFPSDEPVSMFDENPEVKNMQTCATKGKVERVILDGGSESESGKGSNSFAGDSDSATSVYVEAKLEPVYAMACLNDRPSTSYVNEVHQPTYPDGEIQAFENYDEHLQEFGNQVDYIFSEYGDDCIEQCKDKEFEDVIYPIGSNTNKYILSSGRWSVNQDNSDVQSASKRKPTIDQEFEQYFSTLML